MRRAIVFVFVLGALASACARVTPPPAASSPTGSAPSSPPASPTGSPTSSPATPSPSPLPSPSKTDGTLPESLLGEQWDRLPTNRKVVALTFDAGGDNAGVASILTTLQEKAVPGTFFMTGRWARTYVKDARLIAGRYDIGNHTDSHPDLTRVSDAVIREELAQAEASLVAVTGQDPRPLFRFPYGASSAHAIKVVNGLGYGCIFWTVASRGWLGTSGGETEASIVQQVLGEVSPGAIILMHVGANPDDRSTLDAEALTRIIDGLRARGYSFVTIGDYLH